MTDDTKKTKMPTWKELEMYAPDEELRSYCHGQVEFEDKGLWKYYLWGLILFVVAVFFAAILFHVLGVRE